MTDVLTLKSDDVLDDIEHHFRVTAGPGAGKTHWLTKHIIHVARSSTRLTPCSRIGVISYTNVAVREILGRLKTAADAVDASTIHSFLFRNLVRPYAHLLKEPDGQHLVAHHLVETHGEHYPAHDNIEALLTDGNKRQLLLTARKASLDLLKQRLRSLTVRVDGTGAPFFAPCKSDPRDAAIKDLLTVERLLDYKRRFWKAGTVDHEDVLYFAYRLLHEYPTLRGFLSDRFPYLFMDEFQDTLPVQAAIVRWLAEQGTVVGVIGDPEQAIFGFVDASPNHFHEFELVGHRKYAIAGNQRSTDAIVKFLNRVRTDGVVQHAIRPEAGIVPLVYGGNLGDALVHARAATTHPTQLLVLARKHASVMQARRAAGSTSDDDPWEAINDADPDRCRFLNHVATATDLAQRRFFDLAIQRLVQGISSRHGFRKPLKFDGEIDLSMRRSLALSLLEHIMSRHEQLLQLTALDFYNALLDHTPKCIDGLKLTAVTAGKKFHEAATACRYADLIHALRTSDETRMTRTIHQAKGAEASAVFVVLEDGQAEHILSPVPNDEEQRITYVALSRTRDQLFLFCPSVASLPAFETMGLTTMVVGTPPAASPAKKKRAVRKTPEPS